MSGSIDSVRVLFVEDMPHEAELSLTHLRRAGIHCVSLRVETEATLRSALNEFEPTIILSDFSLPQFDGMSALSVAHAVAPHIPFIFVSGTIGEERAIEALLCGAVDYVLKTNLARLVPAVRRALNDAAAREEQRRQEAQIARLDRVLRMMSGVNAMVVRIRDRQELLRETCRLAVQVGGYGSAILVTKSPGTFRVQPVAWNGSDPRITDEVRAILAETAADDSGLIAGVLRTGRAIVCNDNTTLEGPASLKDVLVRSNLGSSVALPLHVDTTPIGVLFLAARDINAISDAELRMLREVSGNLSFALQYLQQDTKVRFLSHFDPQTGLARRSLFCERLSRKFAPPGKQRSRVPSPSSTSSG